jgi:hypothetical protein
MRVFDILVLVSLSMPGPVGWPSTEGSADAAIAPITLPRTKGSESCCDELGIGDRQARSPPGKLLLVSKTNPI